MILIPSLLVIILINLVLYSCIPTLTPTAEPTVVPTTIPTSTPTVVPTYSPSVTPTEYPTYLSGVHVYFQVTQLLYNVSYSDYELAKVSNDAVVTKTIVESIGYDIKDADISITSTTTSTNKARGLSTASSSLQLDYHIDAETFIFIDSAVATEAFMQALKSAIESGSFIESLHDYSLSTNSTLISSTSSSAIFTTALPTSAPTAIPSSSPSSGPTASPTKAPVNLVAANVLGTSLTSEVVRKKTNYYLGAYLAYFLAIYVIIYLISYSRLGTKTIARLYESAYDSKIYSKFTNELDVLSENAEINDVLMRIYDNNKRVHNTVKLEEEIKKVKGASAVEIFNIDDDDDEEDNDATNDTNRGELAKSKSMKSFRRTSINTHLLSMMKKNTEKFSVGFFEYLQQRRTLLGSRGIFYPNGYSVKVCGWSYALPIGLVENVILYVCINHAFFNCFYYIKGSKLGRHGTKLVYICREVVVFVLSQFFSLLVAYMGMTGTGTDIIFNVFIVVPMAQVVGFGLVSLYTCPCTDSVEFHAKYSRLHGYVLLLGRIALLPILAIIFGALVVACIFSTTAEIGLIIASYAANVQIFGIFQRFFTCALQFVDGYYFEFSVLQYKALSVGGIYLERIVHEQLKNNIDFTATKTKYLCGIVTVIAVVQGVKAVNIAKEHVVIEMNTTKSKLHSDDMEDDVSFGNIYNTCDDVETIQYNHESQTSPAIRTSLMQYKAGQSIDKEEVVVDDKPEDEVFYDTVYNDSPSENIQYSEGHTAAMRASLMQHKARQSIEKATPNSRSSTVTTKLVPPAKANDPPRIDIDSMTFEQILKQYRKEMSTDNQEMSQSITENTDDTIDDKLFEEWKVSKRKQFKQGTRSSFVEAYNKYEDLFSKNMYNSVRKSGGHRVDTATGSPLLSAATRTVTSSDANNAVDNDAATDSASHTRKLYSQQSFKARISLDHKNKRKI